MKDRNKNTAAATELRVQILPCFCLHSKTKLMRLTVQQGCEQHVSVSKLCTQADVIKPDLNKPKWISSADAVHEGHWQSLSDRARRLILCDGPARLTVGKHIPLPSFLSLSVILIHIPSQHSPHFILYTLDWFEHFKIRVLINIWPCLTVNIFLTRTCDSVLHLLPLMLLPRHKA